jgi:hypothetical protein
LLLALLKIKKICEKFLSFKVVEIWKFFDISGSLFKMYPCSLTSQGQKSSKLHFLNSLIIKYHIWTQNTRKNIKTCLEVGNRQLNIMAISRKLTIKYYMSLERYWLKLWYNKHETELKNDNFSKSYSNLSDLKNNHMYPLFRSILNIFLNILASKIIF